MKVISNSSMTPELKKEYINGLKAWVEEDKKVILLGIGFDLAAISLIISNKVPGALNPNSILIALGMLSLLFSAYFLFVYYHGLHLAVREIHRQLKTLNIYNAENALDKLWKERSLKFHIGLALLYLGVIIFIAQYILNIDTIRCFLVKTISF